jgi:hypothetical protein
MRGRRQDLRRVGREDEADRRALSTDTASPATPQDRLLRAARDGRFAALVARARPAQPVAMITPEEREAGLRPDKPEPEPKPEAEAVPAVEERKPEPVRELTPSEQYIAEHCRWVPVHEREHRRTNSTYGRLMTEYDPLTGEIIGDGYIHDDEDDEW